MLLIIDTSSSHLAIGLADEEGTLRQEFQADAAENERGIHDARLATETEKLMKKARVIPNEISRIGLIIGPGSFTGLRIGLSFAKSLAFAIGAVLVPLTSHEVMVAEGGEACYIVTPGYRADLFYVTEPGNPREVHLVSGEIISSLRDVPMLVHESFRLNRSLFLPKSVRYASPSLKTLALLTAHFTNPLRDFDSLEPLYLTESRRDSKYRMLTNE